MYSLLSIRGEELISIPKVIIFWPNLPPGNEKPDFLSNPMPQPEYAYLSISVFSVKGPARDKHFFSVVPLILEPAAPNS